MTILRPAAMIGLAIFAMAGTAVSQSVDAGVATGVPAASAAIGAEAIVGEDDNSTADPASTAEAGTPGSESPGEQKWTAGDLIGRDVTGAAGRAIGEIEKIVAIRGEVMAVIGVGGFLGIGEHEVALPLSELFLQQGRLTAMGYTRSQLNSMREFPDEYATPVKADREITLKGS